jgi:preprotein translocase subunit SecD
VEIRRDIKAVLPGLLFSSTLGIALIVATVAVAEPIAIEVISATAGSDQRTGEPIVLIKMSTASGRLFGDLTSKCVGCKVLLRVDGQALVSAVIREPILAGSVQISDRSFTVEQTKEMAERISAGKAKIEFEIKND